MLSYSQICWLFVCKFNNNNAMMPAGAVTWMFTMFPSLIDDI